MFRRILNQMKPIFNCFSSVRRSSFFTTVAFRIWIDILLISIQSPCVVRLFDKINFFDPSDLYYTITLIVSNSFSSGFRFTMFGFFLWFETFWCIVEHFYLSCTCKNMTDAIMPERHLCKTRAKAIIKKIKAFMHKYINSTAK